MKQLPMVALCMIASSQAWGHASFLAKDNLDAFSGREYKEGSSANIAIALGHGCHNEDRSKWFATTSATVVFPNGADISDYAYTQSRGAAPVEYAGNAIMGIRTRTTANFKAVHQIMAGVPTFYNHGARSEDVRAIHWVDGYVPNEMYDNLEFRASFPKLKGCVKKLRVYTPVVQYCENGDMLAWMKNPTTNFPEAVISPGYAPYFDVMRDMAANPLDASCGEGMEKEVYPSEQAIDFYSVHHANKHHGHGMGGDGAGTDGGHMNHGGDAAAGDGGHMNHGGDAAAGDGGHMNHGGDAAAGDGGHMNHGGDAAAGDGGHMNHGSDAAAGDGAGADGGHMNHGGDAAAGDGGHMNHGSDAAAGDGAGADGGHMNHGGDAAAGDGGHMNHGSDAAAGDGAGADGGHMNHGGDAAAGDGGHMNHGSDAAAGDGAGADGGHMNHGGGDAAGGHNHGGGVMSAAAMNGGTVYEATCSNSSCHGADPSFNQNFILEGNDPQRIRWAFANVKRMIDAGVADQVTDAEVDDIAAYITHLMGIHNMAALNQGG